MKHTQPQPQPHTLSLPPTHFAALSPTAHLLAHLTQTPPTRPSGRTPTQSRHPTIHTNSLSHTNGSAVVRTGDTTIVCGVRSEILLVRDIPNYRPPPLTEEEEETDEIPTLALLVPNLVLQTGCSPAHLPGAPPSPTAQTLTHRLLSLMHSTRLIHPSCLRIYHPSSSPTALNKKIIAYHTLHISLHIISLSGPPLAPAWSALLAALLTTILPHAYYDPDNDRVLCSPDARKAAKLRVQGMPIVVEFGVFRGRVLVDLEAGEEGLCGEVVAIVVDGSGGMDGGEEGVRVLRIEKSGGGYVGAGEMRECVRLAGGRWREWRDAILGAVGD